MDVIETIKHEGFTVNIVLDYDAENPREMYDTGSLFVGFPHRSYGIGDEQFDPSFLPCPDCEGAGLRRGTEYDCAVCDGQGEREPANAHEVLDYLRATYSTKFVYPVGMLDHSGVSFYLGGGSHWSDSAGWDSGTCGFIIDRSGEQDESKVIAGLKSEIDDYSAWMNGFVYGYIVLDQNGDDVESCWGYYGSESVEAAVAEVKQTLSADQTNQAGNGERDV